MIHPTLRSFTAVISAVVVLALGQRAGLAAETPHHADPVPLYTRLGGTENVTKVIDELINRAATEPALKRSFNKVGLKRLKHMLVEQICSLTGGGCAYTGDSMRDVHAGLGITQSEFYGLVEVLRDSMRDHGIPLAERNELLRILAPMKRDVVDHP